MGLGADLNRTPRRALGGKLKATRKKSIQAETAKQTSAMSDDVCGAFFDNDECSFVTVKFAKRPPWIHSQAHVAADQFLDFSAPLRKSTDPDLIGDSKHVALCALMTGTDAEDVHASWQAACKGELAEEGETFTYMFTCVMSTTVSVWYGRCLQRPICR
jgi:hypothetical protein